MGLFHPNWVVYTRGVLQEIEGCSGRWFIGEGEIQYCTRPPGIPQIALFYPNRVAYTREVLVVDRGNRVVSSKLGGSYEMGTSCR